MFPRNRSKDITCSTYFQGSISRGLWRFFYYRFTRASRWLLVLTLLFLAYGSNSLDIQTYTPVAYFLCIWLVALIAALVSQPRAELSVRHADRIRVGELLQVDLELTQRRRWSQELTIVPNLLPPALDPVPGDGVALAPLTAGESARLSLRLECRERGVHAWRGFRVETDFPFGIFRAYCTLPGERVVLVTPAFTPLAELRVPVGRRYQPGGIAMASHIGDSFEFIGNREYRDGDNLRDMDWRATARLNRPIIREYREEYFLRVGVVLDTHLSQPTPPGRANFERAVSIAAAVGDYMARSDYIVDIFAAGPKLYHLTAGRSLAYIDNILEILACVESTADEPFALLEPEITTSLAQITSVVCVFMDWDQRRQDFVRQLLTAGAGVKVIVVRDEPCTSGAADGDGGPDITVIDAAAFQRGVDAL